jgi:hypothetical protein
MHVGLGMRGTFTYSDGRATYSRTAVKIGTGSWSVGGEILEETQRGSTGSVQFDGGYHKLRWAEYRWYKYAYCPPRGGPCTWTWRLNHWTGALN